MASLAVVLLGVLGLALGDPAAIADTGNAVVDLARTDRGARLIALLSLVPAAAGLVLLAVRHRRGRQRAQVREAPSERPATQKRSTRGTSASPGRNGLLG